ncbi:multifunctional CCA addition/repair protein [Halioxenophilus aromaticivorans]|uniref:Multifunctional CCA protein n=1 Tax=Halioxenophilus aromaticivorans TaxID=1306992 RepID=A0AAV3TWZ9_9ALTE
MGGAVRDELLGLDVTDRDYVVVGIDSEQMLAAGFSRVGKDFPVFLHPETKDEYALARKERKEGVGYGGFVCDFGTDVTLEEDLLRRDLTINAIAKSKDGHLVDPYGGTQDLKDKVLRHVSPAFVEDPLRVLRVARFAARFKHLGFSVDTATLQMMTQLSAGDELNSLTPERIWKEMARALGEEVPSEYFRVLRGCGALKVLLPEMDALFGVPQTKHYHPEVDTGVHVLMSIDAARQHFNSELVTFCVVLHDLGKGITPQEQWPSHRNHEVTGVPLVEAVCRRLRVPKDYLAMAKLVCEYHLKCHRVPEMKAGTILKLLQALDGFRRPERVKQFAQACESDSRGRLGFEQRPYPQSALLLGCLGAARSVSAKEYLEQGFKGLALAEKLTQGKVGVINQYMRGEEAGLLLAQC